MRSLSQVLVATSEGFFYSYNIDLESGGECTLTRREWIGAALLTARRADPAMLLQNSRCWKAKTRPTARRRRWTRLFTLIPYLLCVVLGCRSQKGQMLFGGRPDTQQGGAYEADVEGALRASRQPASSSELPTPPRCPSSRPSAKEHAARTSASASLLASSSIYKLGGIHLL